MSAGMHILNYYYKFNIYFWNRMRALSKKTLQFCLPFNKKMMTNMLVHPLSIHNYMKTYKPEQVTRFHQRMRVDEYSNVFNDEAVLQQFVEKEKKHYAKWQSKWANRTEQYLHTVSSRRDLRNQSQTEILGNYQYYTRVAWHQGREYSLILRQKLGSNRQEIILDLMKYPKLRKYAQTIQLTKTVFSPCHRYIAFGLDLHNNEETCFMLKNIEKNHIVGVKGWEDNRLKSVDNVVFHQRGDSLGIFFTKMDQNYRPCQLWYQDIHSGEEVLIHREDQEQYYLDISMAKDQSTLVVAANSKQSNKLYKIQTLKSKTNSAITSTTFPLEPITIPNKSNHSLKHKLYANHNGKYFVIWNDTIDSNQIYAWDGSSKNYVLLHQTAEDETVADIDVFEDYVVLYMRKVVSPVVRVIRLPQKLELKKGDDLEKNLQFYEVNLPYQIGSVSAGGNQQLQTQTCLIYLNNIFVYDEGYELNLKTGTLKIKQKFELTGPKFKASNYIVQVHEVPSIRGDTIPLTTIIPKKQKNVRNKMLLHCYGYYGLPYEINFNNPYLAALDEGWSLAYAHIRGGNEKGRKWHEAAIKGKRNASWEDLQDCVAYLLKQQYTHPSLLILVSHSAGAITVWNAINRKPHLYKAVIMSYPFLDVLSALLDSTKALSQSDYAQFGNPITDLNSYNQIQSYSPYESIQTNHDYPFLYIVGGTKDYRCPLEQIAKFITRFRHFRTDLDEEKNRFHFGEKGLLLKVNEGSHEGLADLAEQSRDGCEILAAMDCLIESKSNDVSMKS